MRIGLCALFFLCLISLTAQSNTVDIQALRLNVAQNPIYETARLNLAYQLMLIGESDEALNHYETLIKQDPQNMQAIEGILWALQSQASFRESIDRADEFIFNLPAHAPLFSYKAYGLSQMSLHLAARQHYAKAEKLAVDPAHRNAATLGLGWEYLYLKNYPAAKANLSKLKRNADPLLQKAIEKAQLQIALGAGTNYDSKHSGKLTAALQKAEWSLKLTAEELILDGSRFRGTYGISAGWQNPLADLETSISRLYGDDERVYPASLISLSIKPIFYVGKAKLIPSLVGVYGHFDRFDVQQADLGLQVAYDRLLAGYTLSLHYQDNQSTDSDSSKQLHSFNLGVRITPKIWLGSYIYQGKQAWWTNPYGVIYDSFEASSSAYGFSLSSPLCTKMGVLLYHQIGIQDNESEHSSFITLTYSI
ncbi:MAG: hypothetical protein RBR69_01435 [Candidatus Cloacimonadaceae bacterium]|jgi:tetratricopeptide (TPR) repeat protein|nr:hypothetical protein [Candidatus Cloacimonadota bacterium]MDY0126788.1 hypothetical protein [Candidatus Cloacimonadaceae bacterium]MCB5254230.1 hypothetical protein [Candidatus Cloacimonadota bacterium]MCK9177511.1 hypothetical protein [Candidatus Cloacimonadota bacterium]MCK9242115.1 hypothetical protein [Candidatus Cloacimonadota bacterium]